MGVRKHMKKGEVGKLGLSPLLTEAVENALDDRAKTAGLLADLVIYLKENKDRFITVGATAAKYVETLQRSNEQLVKVGALVHKNEIAVNLSDDEKDRIFDTLQQSGEDNE